jgi:PAS domain S-box-containing protein
MTHLWESGILDGSLDKQTSIDAASMPWWMERLQRSEVLAVSSVEELPKQAAAERSLLEAQGVQSLVDVPLIYKGKILGFSGLGSARQGRVWTQDEINLLKIVGQVFTNALQHKQAEETLGFERNLLRTVVDNLPDYIYAKDINSRFVLNNRAHTRLLRANTPEEVFGKTDYDIFPRGLADQYFADEQGVIESGKSLVNREESVLTEDGNTQWVLTTKVPWLDNEGKPKGIVGMSRDITQRKEMAQTLEEHAQLLEQANAELRLRNQELDEFTYIASHDLQEPLRKLIAFSDVLREDMAAKDQKEVDRDLEIITSAAQRMQTLVKDLLALSRSGRQSMAWESVNLSECVALVMDTLDVRVRDEHATVVQDALPTVTGDRTLLVQLYQNLIGNALKFHGDSAPELRLTAEETPEGWLLGVADNGIGIKPEYAEQIFAPFKRLHGRSEYEGTGIGLAICRKIVERHGGRIWVTSALGQGAHFKFTLGAQEGDAGT